MKRLLSLLAFVPAFLYMHVAKAEQAPLSERVTMLAVSAPAPWTPPGKAEPANERAARLEVIARAIADQAESPPDGWRWGSDELAALLLATTYEEGWRWRRDVHDGRKLGDRGKARCLAQLHRHPTWMPRELWLASTGTDLESTRICVAGAARVLAHYSAACTTSEQASRDIETAFARVAQGYGTGARCRPDPWARARARLAINWLRLLKSGHVAPVSAEHDVADGGLLEPVVRAHDPLRLSGELRK